MEEVEEGNGLDPNEIYQWQKDFLSGECDFLT